MRDIAGLEKQEKQGKTFAQKIQRERATISAVERKLEESQAQYNKLKAFREGEECSKMQRDHKVAAFMENLQKLPSSVRSKWKSLNCDLHLMSSANAGVSAPFSEEEESADLQVESEQPAVDYSTLGGSGLDLRPDGSKLALEVGELVDKHALAKLDEKSEDLDQRLSEKKEIESVHEELNHHINSINANGYDPHVETLKLQQRVYSAGTGNPQTGSKYDDEIAAVEARLMEYNTKQTVKKVTHELQQTQAKAVHTHKQLQEAKVTQQKQIANQKKKDYENLAWALDDPEDDFVMQQRTEELMARARGHVKPIERHPNAAPRGFYF